jgi:hypothetical protein
VHASCQQVATSGILLTYFVFRGLVGFVTFLQPSAPTIVTRSNSILGRRCNIPTTNSSLSMGHHYPGNLRNTTHLFCLQRFGRICNLLAAECPFRMTGCSKCNSILGRRCNIPTTNSSLSMGHHYPGNLPTFHSPPSACILSTGCHLRNTTHLFCLQRFGRICNLLAAEIPTTNSSLSMGHHYPGNLPTFHSPTLNSQSCETGVCM